MKIQWTNKYSNEQGYVKSISKAKKCFMNTFDVEQAREFKTEAAAQKTIDALIEMGEGLNNNFAVVQ